MSRLVHSANGSLRVLAAGETGRDEMWEKHKRGVPFDLEILTALRQAEVAMGFTPEQRSEVDRVGAAAFGWPHVEGPEAGMAQPARGGPPGPNHRRMIKAMEDEHAAERALTKERKKAARAGRAYAAKTKVPKVPSKVKASGRSGGGGKKKKTTTKA